MPKKVIVATYFAYLGPVKNELYIDGIRFLTAREAGDVLGYAPDYISRLCREGKLRGRRSGKSWIVEADSLIPFLKKHEAKKEAWHSDLSRELKSIAHIPESTAEPRDTLHDLPALHVAPSAMRAPLAAREKIRVRTE